MIEDVLIFLANDLARTEAFVLLLILIALDLLQRSEWHNALLVLFGTIGVMVSVTFLKAIFAIPRPLESLVSAPGFGFPSGHGAGVVFLSAVLWCYCRGQLRLRAWPLFYILALFIVLIGASRIYLGVHTLPQVLGGYVIGALWSLLLSSWKVYKK